MLAALTVACCWGGNFSASKLAMMDFPPFEVVAIRFVIVSLLLAPLALRQPRPRMRDMAVVAMTLIVMQFCFVFVAMRMGLAISSAIVATQMGVPFACMVSAAWFKDYLGPWRSMGLMVAFFGVIMVALTPNASAHWGAFMLATLGALSWACANIYMKQMPQTSAVNFLFWPALFSLPPLIILSLLFEDHQLALIQQARWQSWAGIAYSILFSSLVGYGLWNWLIKTYPLSRVVPFSLFVPVAGITGGVLVFDEPLTAQIIGGAALTILGVGIITLRRPKLAELEQV